MGAAPLGLCLDAGMGRTLPLPRPFTPVSASFAGVGVAQQPQADSHTRSSWGLVSGLCLGQGAQSDTWECCFRAHGWSLWLREEELLLSPQGHRCGQSQDGPWALRLPFPDTPCG